MPHHLALALKETVDREAAHLRAVAERDAAEKPLAHVWSKKEELGHLTDSAANNHVRFVRATIEPEFRGPGYEQDSWVSLHGYHDMRWTGINDFWQKYNHFLAGLVERIPEDRLATPCV